MRDIDRLTTERYGIASLVLMSAVLLVRPQGLFKGLAR